MTDNKTRIKQSLQCLLEDDFGNCVTRLLDTLGYKSDRILHHDFISVFDFVKDHLAEKSTLSEQNFISEVESIRVLFQLTDTEIDNKQSTLFDNTEFDSGQNKSFIFVAVKLKRDRYSRGQYASFTREINKRFKMPVVVLFKTTDNFHTIAFVHRRENYRDSTRHVLGRISLIKEIHSDVPHRAHVDILESLMLDDRLKWIKNNNKSKNFDGLLDAWLNVLDIEELNKKFYRELFDWFLYAVKHIKLPKTISEKPEEHILRLITRLLFIWFIKYKDLVSEDLFNENKIMALLKSYDRYNGDSYYRVILQNLFFATLNTEILKRGFRNDFPDDVHSYHYKNEINDLDTLQILFNKTPFINGGLFDCLDNEDGSHQIDYFVNDSTKRHGYSIPNFLFFNNGGGGGERGNKNKHGVHTSQKEQLGLFDIFNKYNFTVEENTPFEQEVALDPELLGKVFENLLAAYNPETRETARKQDGSYYTPRIIVDYIVNESLILALTTKVSTLMQSDYDSNIDTTQLKNKIRFLLTSDDSNNIPLTDIECNYIVHAISKLKIIDPAVGSGAFLMSALNKLTNILNKIDYNNEKWSKLQLSSLSRLNNVNQTLTAYNNYDDFSRKLYLIQNNLYGVDIQPIAISICKLRFFISLVIEQKTFTDQTKNYGIKPLPNLETRFVAANTLVPLDKHTQQTLGQTDEIIQLEKKILRNHEQYFYANDFNTKIQHVERDKQLRNEITLLINSGGKKTGHIDKIAKWNPYNPNISANWFDPLYMFGVSDGFDMVIGNPPYGAKLTPDEKTLFNNIFNIGDTNTARLFIHKSLQLLTKNAVHGFIIPKSLMFSPGWKLTRNAIVPSLVNLVDVGKVWDDVNLEQCVYILQNNSNFSSYTNSMRDGLSLCANTMSIDKKMVKLFGTFPYVKSENELKLGLKLIKNKMLQNFVNNTRGVTILASDILPTGKIPVLGGKAIQQYYINGVKGYVSGRQFNLSKDTILAQNILSYTKYPFDHIRIVATIPDKQKFVVIDTVNRLVVNDISPYFILGLLNSKILGWYAYHFLFSGSTMTMHFDKGVTDKIPIKISELNVVIPLVKKILKLSPDKMEPFKNKLDKVFYDIFELTKKEKQLLDLKK